MFRLEKSVRAPEYTALKAPASKNLCNVRVNNPRRVCSMATTQNEYEGPRTDPDRTFLPYGSRPVGPGAIDLDNAFTQEHEVLVTM